MGRRFRPTSRRWRTWKDSDDWLEILNDVAGLPEGQWFEYHGEEGTPHSIRQGIASRKEDLERLRPGVRVRMRVQGDHLLIRVMSSRETSARPTRFAKVTNVEKKRPSRLKRVRHRARKDTSTDQAKKAPRDEPMRRRSSSNGERKPPHRISRPTFKSLSRLSDAELQQLIRRADDYQDRSNKQVVAVAATVILLHRERGSKGLMWSVSTLSRAYDSRGPNPFEVVSKPEDGWSTGVYTRDDLVLLAEPFARFSQRTVNRILEVLADLHEAALPFDFFEESQLNRDQLLRAARLARLVREETGRSITGAQRTMLLRAAEAFSNGSTAPRLDGRAVESDRETATAIAGNRPISWS
jgi:hypothetical protein